MPLPASRLWTAPARPWRKGRETVEKTSRDQKPRELLDEAAVLLVENEPLDQAREGAACTRGGTRRKGHKECPEQRLLPKERQLLQFMRRQGDDSGVHESWDESEQLSSSNEALIVFDLLGRAQVAGLVKAA